LGQCNQGTSAKDKEESGIHNSICCYDFLVIEYFEIDTDEEVVEPAKAQNETSAVTLNMIGLTKVNDDHWICKADYDSSQPVEEDDNGGTSAVEKAMMFLYMMFHTLGMRTTLLFWRNV